MGIRGQRRWSNGLNWLNHASVENNKHAYFGNAIDQASQVSLATTQAVTGLTFFSDHAYRIVGAGELEIGTSAANPRALIDGRQGSHYIAVETDFTSDVILQVLDGATITFNGGLDLNGHELRKLGAGTLNLLDDFRMRSGQIVAYASNGADLPWTRRGPRWRFRAADFTRSRTWPRRLL